MFKRNLVAAAMALAFTGAALAQESEFAKIREEIQQMKKHTRSYAKLIISIASNIINDLLNNETNDEDDNISDGDVICLRGLEKFISNHKCPTSSSSCSFALSTNGKRKIMMQHVLLEQNTIKVISNNYQLFQ